MGSLSSTLRNQRANAALLVLFFLSGATALAYQALWVRELQLVFGTTTFAIATVLSAFMAGLAIGGFAVAQVVDRWTRPLAAYGVLEIVIGVYALVFPWLVDLVAPAYLTLWRDLQPGPVLFGMLQFALVGVTLLIPTAMMGATLPLLARFAARELHAAGDGVGTLYAVNTAGAVFGTWLCGFVLLPGLGRSATTWAAASANLVLGLVAVALSRWVGEDHPPTSRDSSSGFSGLEGVVLAAMFLAGGAALVNEVAWTRLLGLMLGASTYAFSIMLLAFLIGIAAGGKIGGRWADRLWKQGGALRVLRAFAAIEIAIALVSCATMYLYPEIPFWYVGLFDAFGAEDRPQAVWWLSLVLAVLVMTPPATLMGIHFPLAVRALTRREDQLGAPVGWVYGANTAGGVVGAFAAGFVLLPRFGVQGTILVASVAGLSAATLLAWRASTNPQQRARWGLGVGFATLAVIGVTRNAPWDPMLMTSGMYHYVSHFSDHSREGIRSYSIDQYDLVFYEEGLSSVVTVAENHETGNLWLANNGKVDASTSADLPTQLLCSLLGLQYVEEPDDVLVIGLASGITAGALTLDPRIETLDVVELEPAVVRAARLFDAHNDHVLDDPRVRIHTNDGRNHVLVAEPNTYDLIVSEPSNPWISGVSNLFTKEFYEIGKSRLKAGGVWSQWVQLYGMDSDSLRTLLATFADVFPYVAVYATIEEADLVLIGADEPMHPTYAHAERLLARPAIQQRLRDVDVDDPWDLVAMYVMGDIQIGAISNGVVRNTDDNMRVEYDAPLSLHMSTKSENYALLLPLTVTPWAALGDDPHAWADLAHAYDRRGDEVRSVRTMIEAIKALPQDDPTREAYLLQAEAWQRAAEDAGASDGR